VPRWTRIRSVDVHPQLWPSRKLISRGAAAEEIFAKQASAVTELYSMHLAAVEPVPALTWWVRLKPVENPEHAVPGFGNDPAEVTWGEGEVFAVVMDREILDLPADERARRYLDWLQSNLLRLAEARSWPTAGFEEAYARCLADDIRLMWRGNTKTSPNRRYTATPEYVFDENGDCWTTVVVRDRADDVVARGGPWDCYPELKFIKRSAQSLRWGKPTIVEIATWPAEFARAWGVLPSHTLAVD
jgi:hypothetical protein